MAGDGDFRGIRGGPHRRIPRCRSSSALTCDSAPGEASGLHVIPPETEAALVVEARRRHAVLAAAQLRSGGPRPARHRRPRGSWLAAPHHRGVYALGALETELTAPAAALLAFGPNAILSHRTAAVIWRLLPARPADPVDVTLLNANRRPRPGVRVHYAQASEIRRRHGLRITSPARTLRDLAATSPDELEHAYNEALVLRLVTNQEVRAVAAGSRALRGSSPTTPG